MFVTDNSVDGIDTLYRLDELSGLLTPIGPTGVADGLTTLTIPEPVTLVLLAGGALGLSSRSLSYRRRSSRRGSSQEAVRNLLR